MSDHTSDPNIEQITIWRNLLDAFGQLRAAWDAAAEAERAAESGAGPAALKVPEELILSFSRAGSEVADALAGVAAVLANQSGQAEVFGETAETQREARELWSRSHAKVAEESAEPEEGSST